MTTNTSKTPTVTEPGGPVYRFGDQAGEHGNPAWQAINQTFSALILVTQATLDSEWVLISAGATVAFVDLINGTVVPFSAVLYAVPA